MGKYLDKFKSLVGQKQTEQVLKLLNKKRNSGQIRTIEEFSNQLESLIKELTETVIKPTSTLYEAEAGQEINSETYNFMMDRVQDDLETAFAEAQNIDEVQRSHHAIVRDVTLKNLRAGIAELEARINLYEFLNKDIRGFDNALFTTFKESKENRVFRGTNPYTSILFLDPRAGDVIPSSQDGAVDLTAERLTLAAQTSADYTIRDIREIYDDSTPQTELEVEPATQNIRNIIDKTNNTYWTKSLIYQDKRDSVKVKLELDLGIVREVNTISIEPIVEHPVILESISYLDHNNVLTTLTLAEQTIDGPATIQFKKISSNKLILTFRSQNYTTLEFEYDVFAEYAFNQAQSNDPKPPLPEAIQSAANFASSALSTFQSSLGSSSNSGPFSFFSLPPVIPKFTFYGYEFKMGFDNIFVGLSKYKPRSIFVSSPMKLTGAGQLGLKAIEKRPYTNVPTGEPLYTDLTYDNLDDNESGGTNSRNFLGSIEYWIVKQDYSATGTLNKTSTFPILPLGAERIHHERLILSEKSTSTQTLKDIGTLIFFTNLTDGDIKVYRNFELLTNQTGNPLATDGWKIEPEPPDGSLFRTPNNGQKMKYKIKVINPLATDIYTVSYTPIVSSTKAIPETISELSSVGGVQVVDLIGDLSIRPGEEQVVYVDKIGEDQTTIESYLYLVIILRQNTAVLSLSPMVEEYTLVTGYKNPDKLSS